MPDGLKARCLSSPYLTLEASGLAVKQVVSVTSCFPSREICWARLDSGWLAGSEDEVDTTCRDHLLNDWENLVRCLTTEQDSGL